ncbi:MAG TPA: AraC family transcriptional regulator [Chloroflexota bacterium]|nr:AraC family transcriptional regulator [Chloroflexota bacterium]
MAPQARVEPDDELFSSIRCTVLAAGQYAFAPGWRLARTSAPHYRMFVATDGAASFSIGDRSHALAAGGVVLVPPHTPHEARHHPAAPLSAYVIDFEAKLHGVLDVAEVCGLPVSLMPSALRRPKFAASAHAIAHHLAGRIPGYQLAVHSHCLRLLDLLWKEALARGARGGELLRFRPVFTLVERRFGERLTLRDLADTVHLHPAYFSASFKRAAGVGPHEFVARYRLERARDLLVASDLPLDQIARRTGFFDAAHLVRVFRRHEGTSPGRYRRAHASGAA